MESTTTSGGERAMERPWYRDGIRFQCERCGNCCTGAPGRVWFDPDELAAMSAHLGLLPFEFLERHARRLDGRNSLVEVDRGDGNFDCVFLRFVGGKAACAIHPVKPRQCRTYPFWPENLSSRSRFESATRDCEGAKASKGDPTARRYGAAEIDRIAAEG